MSLFSSQLRRTALSLSLAIGLGSATATAGLIDPGLEIDWWVDGVYAGKLTPSGVYNDAFGWWNYDGSALHAPTGVSLSFNLNGDPDPLITGNLTVENLLLPSVDITLVVILPIAPMIPGGTTMTGSAALTLTSDIGGGSFSTLAGSPLWQGLIDGVSAGAAASLFSDPFGMVNPGFGSQGSSANFGPVAGPAALNSIGIEINFSLSQLDQASITSVFHVVAIPGPGVIALLAVGAVGTRRRRRR